MITHANWRGISFYVALCAALAREKVAYAEYRGKYRAASMSVGDWIAASPTRKRGLAGLPTVPKAPLLGVAFAERFWFAFSDPIFNPLADFRINPSHSALTENNSLWELSRLFESCDMLEAIGDTDRF